MNFISLCKAMLAVFISLFMAVSPAGFPRVPHQKQYDSDFRTIVLR